MNLETAFLILRMEIALADEGVGPHDPQPTDPDLIAEAVKVAGHLIEPVILHYTGLITDAEYAARTEQTRSGR